MVLFRIGSCLGLAGLLACGEPPPPIVFTEVTGDRVPRLEQVDFVDPNQFSGLGAAVGDVDGDGRPDLYFGVGGLYLNRPDPLGFRLEAAPERVPVFDLKPIGVAFADYDRDGDLDLTVAGHGGVRLLANDGSGRFHEVTAAAGVAGPPTDVSLSVAWGDLDGDGYLDLSVGNYGVVFDRDQDQQASHIYLNQRNGTFREMLAPGLQSDLRVRAWVTTFADFDGDGVLDLHFGDDREVFYLDRQRLRHDRVFLNRGLDPSGQLQLAEASGPLGLSDPHATMSCVLGNVSRGSGWELFFADTHAGWLYRTGGPGQLYEQTNRSSALDLSDRRPEYWVMWGGAFADLDGDGWEELLVGQAPIHPDQADTENLGPVLLLNHGGTFEMVRYAFGGPMRARALLMVDLDGDGDQDAIVVPFFDRFRFFVNDTEPRSFVRLRLAPTVSAPGAVGAVVAAGDSGIQRMRVAGGQPSSAGEEIVDLAVRGAAATDLTITWPSGAVQTATQVSTGTLSTISEPRWIALTDARPLADGATHVTVTIDAALAGLGGPGSQVTWSSPGLSLRAACDANGVAAFDLPPRTTPGPVQATVTIDGRAMPAHPTLDYR